MMCKKLTTQEFVKKAMLIHGVKYDYSLVDYKNYNTKVVIICPVHGQIKQQPTIHLNTHGCQKCRSSVGRKKISSNSDEFIHKANVTHGGKYDYSEVTYVNSLTLVKVICKEHGYFYSLPKSHLKGIGCPKCGIISRSKLRTKDTAFFIEKSSKIHNNFYDYSLVKYVHNAKKVDIICPTHGVFKQGALHHMQGGGCKQCYADRNGFSRTPFVLSCKTGIGMFYIISCFNESEIFIKIGITNRNVEKRYSNKKKYALSIQYTLHNKWPS